jgi:SAM-dependent methyltransferase
VARTRAQEITDFVSFPLRAILPFKEEQRWGLSSRELERFDYAAREVIGHCLDVGCGRHNRFVNQYLGGNGKGIDVYKYEGLTEDHLLEDPTRFPFPDGAFDSVTFIASLNHVPRHLRDAELAEAYRCLRQGGNIIVTMGHPLAELLVHKVVWLHGRLFDGRYDMDSERGMVEGEEYYLTDEEICDRLHRAGFRHTQRKRFATQWGLNHLFVAWKS